jgi:PAS domain S-box-containing protein
MGASPSIRELLVRFSGTTQRDASDSPALTRYGKMADMPAVRKWRSYLGGADNVDLVHDAIIATDLNGVIHDWNTASERIYGYSAAEALGQHVSLLYFPDDVPLLARDILEPLKTKEFHELTVRSRRKDGAEIFVDLRLSVMRDESGSVVSLIGCSNDITQRKHAEDALLREIAERKRIERALRGSDEKLKQLLRHGPAVLWTSQPSGDYAATFVSENVTAIFGYAPEEFLRDPGFWMAHVHPEDRQNVIAQIEERASTGRWFTEYRFLHGDGRYRFVRDSAVVVKDDSGNIVEFIGHMVDVSAEKRGEEDRLERERLHMFAEALLTAQEAERKRVSRELHDDLNQRLATLILEIGLLQHKPPASPEFLRQQLGGLKGQVAGISDDVRRIAHQLHSAGLEQFGLRAALEQECAAVSERTGIQIRFKAKSAPDVLPENISLCLYRVAQECLRNVITHSKAKRAAVTLQGTPSEIRLRVEDKGVGIDPGAARAGNGLGFISMNERLRQVGGTLLLDSAVGRGTRVDACVPLRR